jgi:hypothetical protein
MLYIGNRAKLGTKVAAAMPCLASRRTSPAEKMAGMLVTAVNSASPCRAVSRAAARRLTESEESWDLQVSAGSFRQGHIVGPAVAAGLPTSVGSLDLGSLDQCRRQVPGRLCLHLVLT